MKSTKHLRRPCYLAAQLSMVSLLSGCGMFHTIFGGAPQDQQTIAMEDGSLTTVNPYLLDRSPVPKRAQQQFDQALEAMRLKQWSRAQATLKLLNADYPELSGPWLNLGITYLALDRPEQAEAAFTQAIAVNANNLDAYNQLAAMKRKTGEFRAAEALYKRALAVWPEHAQSHLNLGILYDVYMGELEEAQRHYRSYQALQPEPDPRVAGWLLDLQRQPAMMARAGGGS